MKKIDEFQNPSSCFNKAKGDEMLFVLRGQDLTSPEIIMEWIKTNIKWSVPDEKLREAFECALAMRKTPDRKSPD